MPAAGVGTPRGAQAKPPWVLGGVLDDGSDEGSGSSESDDELGAAVRDESFSTALHRLKHSAFAEASPNSYKTKQAEFKRLLKCNSKYANRIHRKRGVPSAELTRRAEELRQERRRILQGARRGRQPAANDLRLPALLPLTATQSCPMPPAEVRGTPRNHHERRKDKAAGNIGVTCEEPIAMLPLSARRPRKKVTVDGLVPRALGLTRRGAGGEGGGRQACAGRRISESLF